MKKNRMTEKKYNFEIGDIFINKYGLRIKITDKEKFCGDTYDTIEIELLDDDDYGMGKKGDKGHIPDYELDVMMKNDKYVKLEERRNKIMNTTEKTIVRCVIFEQIVDSRFDDISKGEKILNDRKDEIIELCGDDFSVYTDKIEFLDWGDDVSQYRQRYYIRKNNNKVTWNDLYKIVNSVKAVPYDFKKVNDTLFNNN